jgi:hypothetical protein
MIDNTIKVSERILHHRQISGFEALKGLIANYMFDVRSARIVHTTSLCKVAGSHGGCFPNRGLFPIHRPGVGSEDESPLAVPFKHNEASDKRRLGATVSQAHTCLGRLWLSLSAA